MDNNSKAVSLISLGYNDYISARYLIHGGYIIQGVTLASTAVEKYLKAILAFHGKEKKDMGVHLDKLDKIQKLLSECYFDVTKKIDNRFLKILGDAYKIRYYDTLKEATTIGFFINQFIGELDFIVNYIETKVIKGIHNGDGNNISTQYNRDINNKNKDLLLNNYLLSGITKREHMEKVDNGYVIFLDPKNIVHGSLLAQLRNIINTYDDGRMAIIEINKKSII